MAIIKRAVSLLILSSVPVFCFFLLENLSLFLLDIKKFPVELNKIIFCILLFSVSIILRVIRTQYLISKYSKVNFLKHLKAISVGYYFDCFLPFRLGQIARAFYLSRETKLSFGFSLLAIIFEKTFDVLLLGISIIILKSYFTNMPLETDYTAFFGSGFMLLLFGVVILAIGQSPLYLRFISSVTKRMSQNFATQFKHSLWSATLALQKISRDWKFCCNYFLLAVSGWAMYLLALFIYFSDASYIQGRMLSAIMLNLKSSSNFMSSSFIKEQGLAHFILNALLAFLGSLFIYTFLRNPKNFSVSESRYVLDSYEDDSYLDRRTFITNYFGNNHLYLGIHRDLSLDKFEIIDHFKGGSDAITLLLHSSGHIFVRKFVALEKKDKLKSQFDWLMNHQSKHLVKVLGDGLSKDYYFYDMEFLEEYEGLFDIIHKVPLASSRSLLNQVFEVLQQDVYSICELKEDYSGFITYLETCYFSRIASVSNIEQNVDSFVNANTVIINGESYIGPHALMNQILSDKALLSNLTKISSSKSIHGDLTIENILISKNLSTILIDPSDDNEFSGPILDVARMLQSLSFGYEFITRSTSPLEFNMNGEEFTISFESIRSDEYKALEEYFMQNLVPSLLCEDEAKNLSFHVAILYFRMVNHQYRIAPKFVLKYLAMGTIALNEFTQGNP